MIDFEDFENRIFPFDEYIDEIEIPLKTFEKIKIKKSNENIKIKKANNCLKSFKYSYEANNLKDLFDEKENQVISHFKNGNYKIRFVAKVLMKKYLTDTEELEDVMCLSTNPKTYLRGNDPKIFYRQCCNEIRDHFDNMQRRGSGWYISKTHCLYMERAKYKPLKGSSFIDLPPKIKNKKAIINVKNNDEKCFMWAVLSALHPVNEHSYRVTKYKTFENELDFSGINFPVALNDIEKFEKLNNIGVNLFCQGGNDSIEPLLISNKEYKTLIDLFLIKENEKCHYCWIKSLEKLLFDQLSKYKGKKYICRRCLSYFNDEIKYTEHISDCKIYKPVKFTPANYEYVEFKNFYKTQIVPYVIYADFESILEKVEHDEKSKEYSYTIKTSRHIASGFYVLVLKNGKVFKEKLYRGQDCAKVFLRYLIKITDELMKIPDEEMLKLTDHENKSHSNSKFCKLCKNKYTDKNYKVRDHDHFTGKYRQTICNNCNINLKKSKFVRNIS